MIIKAKESDIQIVSDITQTTIDAIYPDYYPAGAVEFFKNHHSIDSITADIDSGIVYLCIEDYTAVGTVTIRENEILRLFVLPEYQHKGYDKELMDFAEEEVSRTYSKVVIDASLAAKNIYKVRGYTETSYNRIKTSNGQYLCYDVMEKELAVAPMKLSKVLDFEKTEVLKSVNEFDVALTVLDQYDHQSIAKPKGTAPIYEITYEICYEMVSQMRKTFDTAVFGREKEPGKVKGIIAAIYQSAFGEEVYPSLEEKAANLLYFMIKDHPYDDGCKRIAASLFLEFLGRNDALKTNGRPRLGKGELVALTLLIAESNPEEKDTMTKLVMNLLNMD